MQLFWLLPALGFGIYLGVSTGNWLVGGLSIVSGLGYLGYAAIQHFRAPILADDRVRFANGRFWIGRRRLPSLEIFWKLDWYDRVFAWLENEVQLHNAKLRLGDLVSGNLKVPQSRDQLNSWLGFQGKRDFVLDLVADGPHALLVGPTGSGKSQLLKLALSSLMQSTTKSEVVFALLDFKGGAALARWFSHPAVVASSTDLSNNHDEVIAWLQQQLVLRETMLAGLGVSRIEELPTTQALPRLVVVVDELQPLLRLTSSQVIEDVAARGRSLGVHLVLTAQNLSGLSRSLLTNLGMKLAVGITDAVELAQLGIVVGQGAGQPNPRGEWQLVRFIGRSRTGGFVFPLSIEAGGGSPTSESKDIV